MKTEGVTQNVHAVIAKVSANPRLGIGDRPANESVECGLGRAGGESVDQIIKCFHALRHRPCLIPVGRCQCLTLRLKAGITKTDTAKAEYRNQESKYCANLCHTAGGLTNRWVHVSGPKLSGCAKDDKRKSAMPSTVIYEMTSRIKVPPGPTTISREFFERAIPVPGGQA